MVAPKISRTYQFKDISQINFSALGSIRLVQGDEESVLVEGTEEALEHVKISQEGGTVHIKLYTWYDFMFIPRPASYTIRVKDLESFRISGSAEMECDSLDAGEKRFDISTAGSGKALINGLKCGSLHASSSGSANYTIQAIESQDLRVSISGSGHHQLSGNVDKAEIHISGSGEVLASSLVTRETGIHISGTGKVMISVLDQLSVHISGSGEVIYTGDPHITNSISGSGKILRK